MFLAQSSVAAARRDSLIAFYGPFVSAFLLITVIVVPDSKAVLEVHQLPADSVQPSPDNINTVAGTGASAVDSALPVSVAPAGNRNSAAVDTMAVSSLSDSPPVMVARLLVEQDTARHLPAVVAEPQQQAPLAAVVDSAGVDSLQLATGIDNEAADSMVNADRQEQPISWGILANSLASYDGPSLGLPAEQKPSAATIRGSVPRPDTLQRPLLPPNRAVRPLQRAEIPPRLMRALVP